MGRKESNQTNKQYQGRFFHCRLSSVKTIFSQNLYDNLQLRDTKNYISIKTSLDFRKTELAHAKRDLSHRYYAVL